MTELVLKELYEIWTTQVTNHIIHTDMIGIFIQNNTQQI
jgi:hypothetical protein